MALIQNTFGNIVWANPPRIVENVCKNALNCFISDDGCADAGGLGLLIDFRM